MDDPMADAEQGIQADGCPVCRVLYPDVAPCPECDGRGAFLPAQMMDAPSIRRAVERAATAYRGDRPSLDALLRLLFVHRPVALEALRALGAPTLDELRRDHARTRAHP